MSWKFSKLPGTEDWEVEFKASHDYNDNYLVFMLPGGVYRRILPSTVSQLTSVNKLGF